MKTAPHIAVVGSANIDLITFTDQMPRPGETIFGRAFDLGFGGKGANQAVAARLCGARVSMIARVGDDLFGPATIRDYEARGIDASRVLGGAVAALFCRPPGQNPHLGGKGPNRRPVPRRCRPAGEVLREADCIVM